MRMFGERSDVRDRAPLFEEMQQNTLDRLAMPEVQAALGSLGTRLVPYIENSFPIGLNRSGELDVPKVFDPSKPPCFIYGQREYRVRLPDTVVKEGALPYPSSSGTHEGHYVQLRPAQVYATGEDDYLVPWFLSFQDQGEDRLTRVFPHEIEHWRFDVEGDAAAYLHDLNMYGVATEKIAYQVSAGFEPKIPNLPRPETIVKELKRRQLTDPVVAARHAMAMVQNRVETMPYAIEQATPFAAALALSAYFGDGSPMPTAEEVQAYIAAGLVNEHIVL